MSDVVRRRVLGATLLAAAVVPAGCGGGSSKDRPTGIVSGTVEMGGAPLVSGVVLLEDTARGIGATATVADGKFTFAAPVPTGDYKVAVQPPPAPPPLQSGPAAPKLGIPARYADPKTSGFSLTVKEGPNDPLPLKLEAK